MSVNSQQSDHQIKDPVGGLWLYSGKASLLFNQVAFSKWASGGVNNVSLGFTVDYEVNYKENGWSWDTKSSGSYGLSYIEGDKFLKKTNDRLEINSLLGKEFSDTWSYSTILNFKSQIARGYRFRTGDDAPMAVIELVDKNPEARKIDKPKKVEEKSSAKKEEVQKSAKK